MCRPASCFINSATIYIVTKIENRTIFLKMYRFFRLLSFVPLQLMLGMGALVGWIVWWSSASYRAQFLVNTGHAGLSWKQTKGAVSSAGKLVGEIPWLWARGENIMALQRSEIDEIGFIEEALDQGRGVIFLAPHLGCWEMGAQLLGEVFGPKYGDMIALYRPARKEWLENLLTRFRSRRYLKFVPTTLSGVRTILKHLKAGGYTAILPDQVPPKGLGVWAPFFGRDVYTMTLLPKIAQQTGSLIVLAWCKRLPGARYKCYFSDLSHYGIDDKSISMEEAAARMNKALEELILKEPDQYLWGYNRGKQPRETVHTKSSVVGANKDA